MKTMRGSRVGFTLVELLVVIGIIAILAAILLPAMRGAFVKTDTTRARAEMRGILAAVKAFYNEYGRMPTQTANGPDITFGDQSPSGGQQQKQNDLMNSLRSIPSGVNSTYKDNPRKILFIEVPEDSLSGTDKNGQIYTNNVNDAVRGGYFLDPWGNPYVICVDMNGDGNIKFNNLDVDSTLATLNTATFTNVNVAVLSYGPGPYGSGNNQVGSNSVITTLW